MGEGGREGGLWAYMEERAKMDMRNWRLRFWAWRLRRTGRGRRTAANCWGWGCVSFCLLWCVGGTLAYVGEDVDAAEGDPDGAEGQAFAGRRVGRYLLPEMLDGLADEGEGEDVGEGGGGVEVEEGRAEVFEERDGENAAVEEEDGGFDEEVFQSVDDRGAPLGLLERDGLLMRSYVIAGKGDANFV